MAADSDSEVADKVIRAALELADAVEDDRTSETSRLEGVRDRAENWLAASLVEIWSDPRLWASGPGNTQVLNRSTAVDRRRVQRARERSLNLVDDAYQEMLEGMLPRQARAGGINL